MNLELDDDFWEDLLILLDEGKVIPVIGSGVVTMGQDQSPFYPWLAKRLADKLGIPPEKPGDRGDLNTVATLHLLNRGDGNALYTRIARILRDECPMPGKALMDLASVSAFNLFLTTTFDPLLQRAIDLTRYGGQPLTNVYAFSPKTHLIDLPLSRNELEGTTVFHLLGQVSSIPDYVVWEEDMLEFMFALYDKLDMMERLGSVLKDHGLLFLGLNFSDWLVRFFLRVSKQEPLSTPKVHRAYLAESPDAFPSNSLVMFFGAVSRDIQVMKQDPGQFCSELARRWQARHPENATAPRLSLPAVVDDEIPKGAIFISYAREDEQSVVQLVRGLRDAGCILWYDRERLRAGDNWHNQLEDAVKRRCGIFLSVISNTTQSTRESYYHLERNWAAQRAERIAHDEEFYIPIVIDESPLGASREPRVFHNIQATRLMGGSITDHFSRRVYELQQRYLTSMERA